MPSNNQFKINEHGFTLIEVLASIVLLAIILTSFGMIFAQSLKTSNTSERIIDHTYIAQREMERIYELSTKVSVEHRISEIKENKNYVQYSDDGDWLLFKKEIVDEQVNIELRLKDEPSSLTRILIKVYDVKNLEKPKVQMENLLEWKIDENE